MRTKLPVFLASILIAAPLLAVEQNTMQLIHLWDTYGASTAADGNPVLSVQQNDDGSYTMLQRTFDSGTGNELTPLSYPIDTDALNTSTDEVNQQLSDIQAIQNLLPTIQIGTPIHIANPVGIGGKKQQI